MTEVTRTFKTKKVITVATLKFVVDQPLHVKLMGKLHEGKTRVGRGGKTQTDSDGNPRKPPTLVECINLMTGEVCQIICAEVIKSEIAEAYPNDSYVGLGFRITKQKRKEGKQYDPYEIVEIELPEEFQDKKEVAPSQEVKSDKKK